ncbi:ERI1 exoribonuclease 3-like isoform X2 [Daktulosphaira vitifoliae]|uniref:ERI1 exoribonuclease 3-like isoform X2 n=1 Tax=Daktulosphaira vitifoliae TaxID=58002 RepID=UPI0021A9F929|nr:ERI1 exoribonuclease 3-like isoform X2 [Daktulosphaira vitifoliae]
MYTLFNTHIFKNPQQYIIVFRNIFIRSINNPKDSSKIKSQQYTKYFILDFEATCDNGPHLLRPQEIIEFPCIAVNFSNGYFERVSCFHSYVKPVINPNLTEFCTQLTGISQNEINESPNFDKVFQEFCKWYERQSSIVQDKCIIVTCGNWDLGRILIEQCKLSNISIPNFMHKWINIKKLYAYTLGNYPYGIKNMMISLNLKHTGSFHSGIVKI